MGQEGRRRQPRIPCLIKLRMQSRGRYPTDPEFVLPNWYRDFETVDKTTLEQLAAMILQILGWAEDHLYEFRIKGRSYVNFGDDADYIVDTKDACVSCAVPMHLIGLSGGDVFEFIFDFGELYTFRLTVTAICPSTLRHADTPRVLSYCGKNILQYPWQLSRRDASAARTQQPAVGRSGRPRNWWCIRFVREKDKRQLVVWRESNDKRKWQKAVTVLENRSLLLEEIAKKVEVPVDVIRGWITTYNHLGLTGLNPPRKKRDPGTRGAAVELKKTRILALIHGRPQSFAINRASWNLPSLAAAYRLRYGETISESTVGRIIRNVGYKVKKARRVLSSPDPEYREKVDLVLSTLRNLQQNELFFFIDERRYRQARPPQAAGLPLTASFSLSRIVGL